MLYCALHMAGISAPGAYKKTHPWHPISMWIRETENNFNYAIRVALALCDEYTKRYKKVHKCKQHILNIQKIGYHKPLETRPYKNKRGPINDKYTPFPCAMPDECIVVKDGIVKPVLSYRRYYKQKNKEWTQKGRPMKFSKT